MNLDARICAEPITTDGRNLFSRKTFKWIGGGGCNGCHIDSFDARRRDLVYAVNGTTVWFEQVYAPMLQSNLTDYILDHVIPLNSGCLGQNPEVTVQINKITLSELVPLFTCRSDDLIAFLTTVNLNTPVTHGRECHACHTINFSQSNDGTKLRNGLQVSNDWKSIGLSVSAKAIDSLEIVPLQAQILDTSNTTCIQSTSTQSFGSPNHGCQGGGPGEGDGGLPGQLGENCNPVGSKLHYLVY
jgi:hypothetical protein